jgi:transcriptional regulator with XRE-family HTH domain
VEVYMEELRRLRREKNLSQAKLAALADLDPSTVNQLETGTRRANMRTLEKLAGVLGVEVADFFPKDQAPLPLEDGRPSLKELHATAGCVTGWLTMPEAAWRASWPPSLTPRDAMQIVQEMAEEFSALKPLMATQEVGLPIYKSAISGRYRQAWLRFFDGMRAAHKCGVANGLITQEETLNDLEKKLGETPGVRYEEMLLAG